MKITIIPFILACSFCFGEPITLKVVEREISVNGKSAKVYGIVQENGTIGMTVNRGQNFDVKLQNDINLPTSIHWHGLILPNSQDGVAFVTQLPIYPGTSEHYRFPLIQDGTYFMHSHFSLQEQLLLAAPLILRDPQDNLIAEKEIVILLSDFTFKSPFEIYLGLRCPKEMHMSSADVIEVNYDAFLANFKTLENPDIFQVSPNEKIRLRFINASSATNFFINLGKLDGQAIAVDGSFIHPIQGYQFELGIAQRIDIVVTVPKEGGIFPILAQGEATTLQTGVVLTTKKEEISLSSSAEKKAGIIENKQESKLRALSPLPKRLIDKKVTLELGGDMENYVWTINSQAWPEVTPVKVTKGDRVEITFINKTAMTHPMHLHGHVFEVTEIDGNAFQGAMRDTVLVGPKSTVKIQFDANNPGVWPLHCHLLYHLEAGMMTVVRYD